MKTTRPRLLKSQIKVGEVNMDLQVNDYISQSNLPLALKSSRPNADMYNIGGGMPGYRGSLNKPKSISSIYGLKQLPE